jgi:hypothetical protein
MANTKRTLVVEIEVSIGTQDGDVLRYIEMMNGVCDAVMYENDSIDALRDVGTRIWKLEGKDDYELAGIRRDIEAELGESFGNVPKSWDQLPVAKTVVGLKGNPHLGVWLGPTGDAGCVASAAERIKGVEKVVAL